MTILVIAPHADDEILGCGGIINKYSAEGHEIIVLITTNASVGAPELYNPHRVENVRKEALEAHKIVGVSETRFLELPAPKLDVYPLYKIADDISELIKTKEPEWLLIPHRGDSHKDHLRIFDAAMIAARPINNCSVNKILAYETLSETEWAVPNGNSYFIPNVYISIEDNLDLKVQAFKKYNSQLKEFPHPRSEGGIISLARYRGSTISSRAAEAFQLIREIN